MFTGFASALAAQHSATQRGTSMKKTNLNFRAWSKSDSLKRSQERDSRFAMKRTKLPNLTQRKSKFLARLVDDIHKQPKLRPSLCTVLTGSFFLLCFLLLLCIPFFQQRVPMWLSGVAVALSSAATCFGFAFFCRHSKQLKKRAKQSRPQNLRLVPLPRVYCNDNPAPSSNGTSNKSEYTAEAPCRKNEAEALERNANIFLEVSISGDTITKEYAVSQHQRKLPLSPGFRPAVSRENAGRVPREVLSESDGSRPVYFSSEPDLHVAGARGRSPKSEELKLLPEESCIKCPHTSSRCRRNCEVADQIFQVFHDPLLYSSITRIKFKCDNEFLASG